jgi:hypothetical protein
MEPDLLISPESLGMSIPFKNLAVTFDSVGVSLILVASWVASQCIKTGRQAPSIPPSWCFPDKHHEQTKQVTANANTHAAISHHETDATISHHETDATFAKTHHQLAW